MSLMPAGLSGLPVLLGVTPGVVRLVIGGVLYEGFEDVEVRRNLGEMASQFTLHVTQTTGPGTDGPALLLSRPIKEQDPCQIFYGSVLVLTGSVEGVQPRYSKTHHSVTIQGRSKTGDLVDSSVDDEIDGGEMRQASLDQMARKATAKFGIGVEVDADVSERWDVARVVPGESVHRFLERYARPAGVSLTDDQMGNLRLFQATEGGPVASLIEGVNIVEGSAMLRSDQRHSKYDAKGQDHGSDQEYGDPVAQRKASASDSAVKRYRPLTLLNESKSMKHHARGRAAWEAAKRSGESLRAEVKVVDWCFSPGQLWMPGLNVQLTSPMLYVNRVLTVKSVVLKQSRKQGTLATLALVPPEAATPKPKGGGSPSGEGNDASWDNTKPAAAPVDDSFYRYPTVVDPS